MRRETDPCPQQPNPAAIPEVSRGQSRSAHQSPLDGGPPFPRHKVTLSVTSWRLAAAVLAEADQRDLLGRQMEAEFSEEFAADWVEDVAGYVLDCAAFAAAEV